ncbi:unnamed protein product [Spirodela intermedia]|uniref:Uncharacterized protein n=1 Tax=Spirodela intermedia TaxID=51605 RepID=A0A7I8K933_SPIIN|nr:unnamed protein product [Spirodela intermedia]
MTRSSLLMSFIPKYTWDVPVLNLI